MPLFIRPSSDDVGPSGSPSVSHSFPHFSPTCFDTLSWNFAYAFVILYYRSGLSVVNCRRYAPFWNLEHWKYTVFRTFLLHAWTYWAEILHMPLLYCTTDQVLASSIVGVMPCPFCNLEYWKYTVFRIFLLHAFTYWAEILHMTLLYYTTDQV